MTCLGGLVPLHSSLSFHERGSASGSSCAALRDGPSEEVHALPALLPGRAGPPRGECDAEGAASDAPSDGCRAAVCMSLAAKAALVVTFNQPSITAEHITLTVEPGSIIVTGEVRLELLPPGTDQIDLAHFLTIHEILKGALAASAQVQQQPVPVGLRVR